MNKPKDPNVTLWYLGTGEDFRPSQLCSKEWRDEQYCRVYQVPCCEMLSRATQEISLEEAMADELIKITAAAEWTRQYKRPLRIGDVFSIGGSRWVYCTSKDQTAFDQAGIRTVPLRAWDKIAIANFIE